MAQAKPSVHFAVALAIAVFVHGTTAKVYNVGGRLNWTTPILSSVYSSWASGYNFTVGDVLEFNFQTGSHTVASVKKQAYDTCNTSSSIISVQVQSPVQITLDSPGELYFICTLSGHCMLGQRLVIVVNAPNSSNSTSNLPLQPAPACSSSKTSRIVVGVVVGGVASLIVVNVMFGLYCVKRRKREKYGVESGLPPLFGPKGMGPTLSRSKFSVEELRMATNGFVETNLLGQGGFGYVHKGVLANGREVAVKSLKIGSRQGDKEFQAEVEIISLVHHKNLVSLVGYCISGSQRMLVYEFVPNNTLEFHLHGKGQPVMDWATRLKIALGAARGLAYLHEDCHPKIIHRDIKAANILLDFNFDAKVADFGLAKFASDVNTHISTRVMGTYGYLAPEYASSGKLTEKSDVFSFGMVLLELITGHRPIDTSTSEPSTDSCLIDWARPLLDRSLEEGDFAVLIDPRLQGNYDHEEMARMVACAAACVRHSAQLRPRMSQIVRALEGYASVSELISQGAAPAQSAAPAASYTSAVHRDTGPFKSETWRLLSLVSHEP